MTDEKMTSENEVKDQDGEGLNVKKQAKDMMEDVKGMSNVKPQDFKPGHTKGMPTALMVTQFLLVLSAIGSLFSGGFWGVIGVVISLITIWGINKRAMWAYWLLVGFLIYSVAITVINWIPYSVVSLIIDIVLLYYIMQSKKWFVESGSKK